MPRILIAGCGYVGQATADLFHRAGWEVEGWTKSNTGTSKSYPIHAIDITNAKQVHAYEGNFDAIVHCAGINRELGKQTYPQVHVEGTRNVVEAARLMQRWQLRGLPVLDRQGNLAGVVFLRDVLRRAVDDQWVRRKTRKGRRTRKRRWPVRARNCASRRRARQRRLRRCRQCAARGRAACVGPASARGEWPSPRP